MKQYAVSITPRTFHFKQPAGTSRGVYTERRSWLIEITSTAQPDRKGIGECAPLPDLSCDASPRYEAILRSFCDRLEAEGQLDYDLLAPYPSMLFGLETALLHLQRGTTALFNTPFSRGEEGIPINGLVWMGTFEEMTLRIKQKLEQGFKCVKLKIGAIDFDSELAMVKLIRSQFSPSDVELRVDANGGFSPSEAPKRLEQLSRYGIHSIEQPIRQHQWEALAQLCQNPPLPIALDEELIGVNRRTEKINLLNAIRPAYLVLKPSLHGGMKGVREWIALAEERQIGTWITSALESNIGLNAIAQLTAAVYGQHITFPQGLGTGQLFTDNVPMPLSIIGNKLWYNKA